MIQPEELTSVSQRLDYVIDVCKYPTQTAFADALEEKPQTITNWRKRDSIGRGARKLREKTGVSTDWVSFGVGDPFPDGPILYVQPNSYDASVVENIERDIDQLMLGLTALIDLIGSSSQAGAKALAARLAAARKQREARGERPALLRSLEVAAERSAVARKRHNPGEVPE